MLTYIPSPETGVWELGPVPIRAYAMFIVLGIIVAVVLGNRRYVARGGQPFGRFHLESLVVVCITSFPTGKYISANKAEDLRQHFGSGMAG